MSEVKGKVIYKLKGVVSFDITVPYFSQKYSAISDLIIHKSERFLIQDINTGLTFYSTESIALNVSWQ